MTTRRAALLWGSLSTALIALACGASPHVPPGGGDVDASVTPGPDGPTGPLVDASPATLRIDYLDPTNGPYTGGTKVIMRGRAFADGMAVTVGGRAVDPLDVQVIDNRRATIVTPPGDPGLADVVVTLGGATATLPGGFTYEALHIDPPSGSIAGGTFVTIDGDGTMFAAGDIVQIDGKPIAGQVIVSSKQITGYTPPGVAGAADVLVSTPAGAITASHAYTYLTTADPFEGGLGGGPIHGNLNVTVENTYTNDGVPGAYVSVGDPNTTTMKGQTDMFGAITFSNVGLVGPISVSASAPMFQSAAFVVFDAQDVTIFLQPLVPPSPPGPFPPGREVGTVTGAVTFGDSTGIGSTTWDLVPEPHAPNEHKRALVFTTNRTPFSGNPDPGPGAVVDYIDDGRRSWDFYITTRPAALAVVAVAGLYNPDEDPDGPGPLPPGVFRAYAVGAARGILVGPGQTVDNVTVVVDTPLDSAIEISLANPPPLDTPGFLGPSVYQTQAYIDLGGEGIISLPNNKVDFPAGKTTILMPNMAPFQGSLSDATYTIFAGAYGDGGGFPQSVRVVRGVTDIGHAVVIDDFLGVPRAVDPPDGGTATHQHLQFAPEGGTGTATFNYELLQGTDGTPYWIMFSRGDQFDLPIPDIRTFGLPDVPGGQTMIWETYRITVPGLSFNDFTYRDLNENFWSAYAADVWTVTLPDP